MNEKGADERFKAPALERGGKVRFKYFISENDPTALDKVRVRRFQ